MPTNLSVPPLSSSTALLSPTCCCHLIPVGHHRFYSQIYVLPATNLIYHLDVRNPQIHPTFEVGESTAHSNPNVQASASSSSIAHQRLEGLQQKMAAIEATLGTPFNTPSHGLHTPIPVYSDNWSVKTVLEGQHKFGFLTEEIPHDPLENPQEREGRGLSSSIHIYQELYICVLEFLECLSPIHAKEADVVQRRILGQGPIPSLMEVCSETRLEKDRTSAMSILTTPTIDSAVVRGPFPMAMFSLMENQFLFDLSSGKMIGTARHSSGPISSPTNLRRCSHCNPSYQPNVFSCPITPDPLKYQQDYKCFHPSSRKYFVSMDVIFLEDRHFFPVSLLQEENKSKESNSNWMIFLKSSGPTLIGPSLDPHNTILPLNQVPKKTYYMRNLKKEVGSPANQPTPIQDFEPLRDQGMTDSNDSHIDSKMSESDRSKTAIPENIGEQGHVDTKVIPDGKDNNDENEGTKSCTKHSIANYVSYENLSPQFRAFTVSIDSIVIPKKVSKAWKIIVLIVHVDDIVLARDNHAEIIQLKKKNGKYTLDLSTKASMLGCRSVGVSSTDRTKHVEIERHFIKERLDNGSICILYTPSSQQVADVLTKGFLKQNFDFCVSKLGLIDIYVPT
ncbi:Cysteine-rich RLK (RECEPTOR-like protein kinase) 8 [Cucumis melo var. makuwa]|uniref:Cysteine-rich RLK (RECEPTOR-like protein kinase) 8 n=1 Tax=Cucumis melo var. makuwa TaxID=1194695 RepID=A0A5A7TKA0_CUCMM|nr:Cysteine-rich RLK (RECEPTOR-like protein kinase) 8 [Cucumis melo var. makuwa]